MHWRGYLLVGLIFHYLLLSGSKTVLFSDLKLNVTILVEGRIDGHMIDLIDETGELKAVEQIESFCKINGLDAEAKIKLLEASLNQLQSKLTNDYISTTFRITLLSPDEAAISAVRLKNAISTLSIIDYPLIVWSTSTTPAYHMVLHGSQEFISNEIMTKGSFGDLDMLKKLIDMAHKSDHSFHGSVFIDVGANLGCYSLYAAALGEVQ